MTRWPSLFALVPLVGPVACQVDSPSPRPVAAVASTAPTPPAPRAEARPAAVPAPPQRVEPGTDDLETPAPLDPAGVLDDEERRLLEADDATLTKDERVARAQAQRKLVMADPEHPLRPVLTRIEDDVASGEATKMAQDMWAGRLAFPDRDETLSPP